uniref:SCP domain-containing protein n=1 Tax=Ascaris lumbricoides TaxID=6252 RepID=A0A0M3ICF7_ASCLU
MRRKVGHTCIAYYKSCKSRKAKNRKSFGNVVARANWHAKGNSLAKASETYALLFHTMYVVH